MELGEQLRAWLLPETPRLLHGDAIPELATLQTAFTDVFGHPAVIDLAYRDLTEQHYWFDRFGAPRAAVPGTSNHGFGLAIDFEEVDEPGYYSWGRRPTTGCSLTPRGSGSSTRFRSAPGARIITSTSSAEAIPSHPARAPYVIIDG